MNNSVERPPVLRLGPFEADLHSGELRKNGRKVRLQGQPFQVLTILLEHPGEVVTREELRQQVWPQDTFVDFDHALNTAIAKIRVALGDDADNPRFVETVPRRGYRLIPGTDGSQRPAPGYRRSKRWTLAVGTAAALLSLILVLTWRSTSLFPRKTLGTGIRKGLAVVEIENMSGDGSLDWLGNGVAELLSTDLAQAKTLDVISTERVRALIRRRVQGEAHLPPGEAQDVAREAHADLFLSGALLKVGSGLRLDLRVQETGTGRVVFADKIEGENAQAVFAMVDRATSGILAQLAPEESPQPNVGASLTANLDALHAYEEGMSYFDRALPDAEAALRRAIEIDPQFAMAHYQLASKVLYDNPAAARREFAYAANLAERLPLPRQQKLLMKAAQLTYDERLPDAEQLLQTLLHEFPREIEPRFVLLFVRNRQGKKGEGKRVLEEIVRVDERQALAHNLLAYYAAEEGDMTGAWAALDKYAALLPPNDPNPIDVRGDLLTISGRYEDAITQYRKNHELNPNLIESYYEDGKIALAYLHEGKDLQAETAAQRWYEKSDGMARAIAAGVLGDVEVGRGELDHAAAHYEEAARVFGKHDPLLANGPLLKAAHIYFEQVRPDAVLELGRRDPTSWAPGMRAMAYILLRNELLAEKEFSRLRSSLTPMVGSDGAETAVDFDRLLAAAYSGHWRQLAAAWSDTKGNGNQLFDLVGGRAFLAAGVLSEAERRLRLALRPPSLGVTASLADHNFLSYMLAQFYLGKVLERTGRKTEAIEAYQGFLSHFKNSKAGLPQIAEARAALKRMTKNAFG